MTFLNPWALLGLLSVPVIIGLHLHLERNRRVIVSSMFLWTFLESKFEGQKPKFIQLSWLLLLDVLIAVLLSLVFARPVIKLPSLGGQAVQLVILIDDSTSMLALDGNPDRFGLAKELAISLIEQTRRRDETILITFGGKADFFGSTLQMSKEDLISAVEEMDVLGTGNDLRAGLALAQSAASFDLPMEVFILTDAAYEPQLLDDFPIEIQWVFFGVGGNNQAVIDPVLESNGSKTELFFRLVNYGPNEVERGLDIRVNQEVVSQHQVRISPLSVQPHVVSISGEVEVVEIQMGGGDILPIDDIAVLSNIPAPVVSIALVTEYPDPIDRAIKAVPGADLTILNPIEYSPSSNYDLVIFRGVLPERWPSGKVIVFDPPSGDPKIEVVGLEKISAPLEVIPHKVLEGVDLAGVRWEFAWTIAEPIPSERLVVSGEIPLLVRQETEDHELFVFLPQLSSGNLIKHPAFPIFLASMVAYSRDFIPEPDYLWGEPIKLGDILTTHEVILKSPEAENGILVNGSSANLDEVGIYTLEMTDRYGKYRYPFGVNAGEYQESNINPREWRLQLASGDRTVVVEPQNIEVQLSPWLLSLVVVLLVLEAWRAWR